MEIISKTDQKKIKFREFSIVYNNFESAEQAIAEIFDELPYKFISSKKNPFIIDAGSNIGIATLFFKTLYPHAKMLCFEPDPNAFQVLKENMVINKIESAQLVNVALAKEAGEIDFFGQIFVDYPDARGNSIIDTWGLQRKISNTTKVKSVKLSSYIHSVVDFLKLDIEGAEQQALEDLEQENKLGFIKEIAIEVHQSDKIKHVNDIDLIIELLNRNQFNVHVTEKDISEILPDEIATWAKKVNPHLFIVYASRQL